MCSVLKILAASSTGERVNVTILGTKFGQSNKGGGSTGEGGVSLERKGKTLLPSPPLPPPKAYPSSLDQRLGGPHLLWSAHYLLPLEYNSAD